MCMYLSTQHTGSPKEKSPESDMSYICALPLVPLFFNLIAAEGTFIDHAISDLADSFETEHGFLPGKCDIISFGVSNLKSSARAALMVPAQNNSLELGNKFWNLIKLLFEQKYSVARTLHPC